MIDINIIKTDATEYADKHFTPEWMSENQKYWIYDAADWFQQKRGMTPEVVHSTSQFKAEVADIWNNKWNEYFGKEDDYFDFLSVKEKIEDALKYTNRINNNKNFNVSSILSQLAAAKLNVEYYIEQYRKEKDKKNDKEI